MVICIQKLLQANNSMLSELDININIINFLFEIIKFFKYIFYIYIIYFINIYIKYIKYYILNIYIINGQKVIKSILLEKKKRM